MSFSWSTDISYYTIVYLREHKSVIFCHIKYLPLPLISFITPSFTHCRGRMSSKKLFDQSVKLEKLWSHIFTATISLTQPEAWFRKVREIVEKQQSGPIWMSETKVTLLTSPLCLNIAMLMYCSLTNFDFCFVFIVVFLAFIHVLGTSYNAMLH